jgi:hypothetical protein
MGMAPMNNIKKLVPSTKNAIKVLDKNQQETIRFPATKKKNTQET